MRRCCCTDRYRLNKKTDNRATWDEDAARRSTHAAKQPLSDAEIESRRGELRQFARTSLAWRALTCFMGCFSCQAFWTALAVFALTRGLSALTACLLSAAAYSVAAAPLLNRIGGAASPRPAPSKPG